MVSADIIIKQVTGSVMVNNVQVLSNDSITIKNNYDVMVFAAKVPTGDLKCTGNEKLAAAGNDVPNGIDTCS